MSTFLKAAKPDRSVWAHGHEWLHHYSSSAGKQFSIYVSTKHPTLSMVRGIPVPCEEFEDAIQTKLLCADIGIDAVIKKTSSNQWLVFAMSDTPEAPPIFDTFLSVDWDDH